VEFGERIKEARLVPSMGCVSDAYDNALAESMVASLKTELLYGRSWASRESVRAAVCEYIETVCNPRRRHSALGCLSPVEYEEVRMKEVTAA